MIPFKQYRVPVFLAMSLIFLLSCKESKVIKRFQPTSYNKKLKGVHFYIQEKAYDGFNIARCRIFDNAGNSVIDLNGSRCLLIPEKRSYFSFKGNKLVYRKNNKEKIWTKNIDAHHDIVFDRVEDVVFFPIREKVLNEKKELTYDGVEGYNLAGEKVFSWYSSDYLNDLKDKISYGGKDIGQYFYIDRHLRKVAIKINSVEIIKKTAKSDAAFLKPGNLILSLPHASAIIIVDRMSKKIVWSHRFHNKTGFGVHSIRQRANGNFLFLWNHASLNRKDVASKVIEFDPVRKDIVWEYPKNNSHFKLNCREGCSVFELKNGNFLISYEQNYSVFEVTRAGEIVWEWFSDEIDEEEGKLRTFNNVMRLEKDLVKQFLSNE